MKMHLIFFDGECPLCNRAVSFVFQKDKKGQFLFAPLKGVTAQKELADFTQKYPDLDTLVLVQDYIGGRKRIFTEGKAVLRICSLLGGRYRLFGWMSYLPLGIFDCVYRWVAFRRYRLFKNPASRSIDSLKDRLLP